MVSPVTVPFGAMLSNSVIVCTHVLTLSQLSMAANVRRMVRLPSGVSSSPVQSTEARLSLKVISMSASALQLSLAVAVPSRLSARFAEQAASRFSAVSAGQVISGAVMSNRTTNWLMELLLPQSSVAVQIRSHEPGHPPEYISAAMV